MSKVKGCVIGCLGVSAALAALVVVGVAAFVWAVKDDPQGMGLDVEAPADVVLGQEFDLVVKVRNERGGPMRVGDVDFDQAYLDGFVVVSTAPRPRKSTRNPLNGSFSHTFDVSVPPGQETRFTFRLRAAKEGLHRGDVDAWEGMRFLTILAQTVVHAAPANPGQVEEPPAASPGP